MYDYQQKLLEVLQIKGFAKSTQKSYLGHLVRFSTFCKKHPSACSYDDVRRFLHHEISVRNLSASSVNATYASLKLYYETALCREWNPNHIPRAKRRRFLPQIITPNEVNKIIDCCSTLKYKAIISIIYSSGLRVSEATHLKVSDIDSKNMRIFIRQGKGFKDRNSILSENCLVLLRQYWKVYRTSNWLFTGENSDNPISERSVQTALAKAVKKVGITKHITPHSLRHSFATHLLNNNVNLVHIQELLGHESIVTTAKYLHLTNAQILGVKSPFDMIGGDLNA